VPVLSDVQVAAVAIGAGWSAGDAVIATAIAFRESGGNSDARGDVGIQTATWGPSIGLWQIRSLKAQTGTGGQRDEVANLNPQVNAKHAFEISNGGKNWNPWSVFTSGTYLAGTNLQRATNAVTLAIASGAISGNAGAAGGFAGATGTASGQANQLGGITDPNSWKRIGFFALGSMLLLIGLFKLTKLSPLDVVPVGKVAKLAKGAL
jgi:hypothetical protein